MVSGPPPLPPRPDPVLSMLRDFREEYRDGRKELVDEIKGVNRKLDEHARDDTNGFQLVNGALKDHGERIAKVETNDKRDAEDREREFLTPRTASSPQLPESHKSWLPAALEKRWVQVIALALALALGGVLRHCAPEALVPQHQAK